VSGAVSSARSNVREGLANVEAASERGGGVAHGQAAGASVLATVLGLGARLMQPTFDAARRRVAVAAVAGAVPCSYPLPGGAVSDERKAAAVKRPRRLKPGELVVRFPKASKTAKVLLYDERGAMRPEAYVELTQLLTDPHQGHGAEDPYLAYEPRLFAILYYVAQHFDRPIEVVSAYRVTQRTRSSSNHAKGRAIDFVVEKVPRQRLMAYLERSFSQIGVGWYPRSTFVHVDVRDSTYYWVDRSRPGQPQRPWKRRIGRKPKPGSDPTLRTIHLPLNVLFRKR
jgi:uncharacterized protein YcbK (DUF882 family)